MKIPDCVSLEMQMADIMAIQEASGFRFDMEAAQRVRQSLACEAQDIEEKILSIYKYYPGKVFTPKRTSAKTGYVAGAPMTKLLDFNPTSRSHIQWDIYSRRHPWQPHSNCRPLHLDSPKFHPHRTHHRRLHRCLRWFPYHPSHQSKSHTQRHMYTHRHL